jgi:hypothetical protein
MCVVEGPWIPAAAAGVGEKSNVKVLMGLGVACGGELGGIDVVGGCFQLLLPC